MIQKAFGDDAMSAEQIKVWHKCFKDGREFVESDPCSGRPAANRTAENVELVRDAVKNLCEVPKCLLFKRTEMSLSYV